MPGPAFFKGPFLLFVLFVPCFLLLIFALLLAMQYKQLRAFISPQPIELEVIPKSLESEVAILNRVHEFFAAENKVKGLSDTLTLSVADMNHLVRTSQTLSSLNLDYHLDLLDTIFIARNSLSSSHLSGILSLLSKVLNVKGYLNSEMKAYPVIEKGAIKLMPLAAIMNGLDAPVSVLNRKGGVEISEWVTDQTFYHLVLSRLQSVQIRDSKLLLIKQP